MNFVNNIFTNDKNNIAIISNDVKLTYGELDTITNRLANKFRQNGFEKDSVNLVQGDNSHYMIIMWIASVKLGGTTIFLSNEHPIEVRKNIEDNVKICEYYNHSDIIEMTKDLDTYSDKFEVVDVDEMDICVITLTSGTSGVFQDIVRHTHKNTLFSITSGSEYLGIPEKGDVVYGTAHLSFSFGIAYGLCVALLYGATTIMQKRDSIIDTLEQIENNDVTMFFSAPGFYRLLLSHNPKRYFNNVKICACAGDFLPTELKKMWKEQSDKYLTNLIGAAETQYLFACAKEGITPDDALGEVLPQYSITYDDVGMTVSSEYLTVTTSDIVSVKNNTLYYYGRSTDILNTPLGKYNPTIIEFQVLKTGLVSDVFAVQFEKIGIPLIKLVCVKSTSMDSTELEEYIKEYCKINLPKYLVPKKIEFVDTLPRTATGKPKRKSV